VSAVSFCESDALVNSAVDDVPFDVNSNGDYQALRHRWTSLPRIPKFLDGAEVAASPLILSLAGQSIRLLLKGEESAGSLMVAHVTMEPGAMGAPDHHQPSEDELWFAVQGEWEWKIGNETRRVGPGAFAYAPRNTTHAFSNVGKTSATMFTINTPAGHERGFKMINKLTQSNSSGAELQQTLGHHDFVFHSPIA
jgi:mannose-6-phosphate isomerase-like protein (cupin superfamily)